MFISQPPAAHSPLRDFGNVVTQLYWHSATTQVVTLMSQRQCTVSMWWVDCCALLLELWLWVIRPYIGRLHNDLLVIAPCRCFVTIRAVGEGVSLPASNEWHVAHTSTWILNKVVFCATSNELINKIP